MSKSRIFLFLVVLFLLFSLPRSQSLAQQAFSQGNASFLQNFIPAAPAPFGKLSPLNGAIDQPISNLILSWNPSSSPNVTYQYCLRTNANCPGPKWISVGTNTSVTVSGLSPNTKYYWQVRAVDSQNNYTYADNDSMWSFQTVQNVTLPGAFTKLTPEDTATNQPVNGLTLSWSASDRATSYQYCYDTINNNLCDTAWTSVSGLSATVSGLSYETIYFWQVRAVNASGNTQADGGTWFLFQTRFAPPGEFSKTFPENNAVDQPVSLMLTWDASAGTGITYEYCYGTAPCTPASTWLPAGTNLFANISGLQYETTYYWQVRAVNASDVTYANNGQNWNFTTSLAAPGAFGKSSPENNAIGQPLSLTLNWGASTGTNVWYEYCYDTVSCTPASTWLLAGTSTSANLSGLAYNTTYFWQVRAVNAAGTTYADGGTVWQFTTQTAPPQPFSKLSPPDAGSEPLPVNLTLQWSASAGASEYFYCVDTDSHPVNDSNCGTGWVLSTDTASNPLSLDYNQTYYWQVYARNSQGTLQANSGVWWSFTTQSAPPTSFTKLSPADGAVDQPIKPWLYWFSPDDAETTYEYCIDVETGCPSDGWTSITRNTPISITTDLQRNTPYFWQVRATNTGGTFYANDGDYWSFTTLKAPPISSNQSFTMTEDTTLSETLTATSNYAKIFTLYGSLPAGTLNLEADGDFTYTPVANFAGTVSFQFIVSDGYNPPVGPYTATITVNGVNDPPTLSPIADPAPVVVGRLVILWVQGTDPDLPYGDSLTYSVDEPLPSGASLNSTTGLFVWAVPVGQAEGVYTFTFRLTDSQAASDFQSVNITVIYLKVYLPLIMR